MVTLLILIAIVAVLVYLAATFLPHPINWIVVLIIIVLAIVAVFGGGVSVDATAKFWGRVLFP